MFSEKSPTFRSAEFFWKCAIAPRLRMSTPSGTVKTGIAPKPAEEPAARTSDPRHPFAARGSVGKMPISLQLGGRYFAEGPAGTPDWGIRFAVILLFPN